MKILFPFHDCVALRYFMPLAIRAKKRGHCPIFQVTEGFKYNGVSIPENRNQIDFLVDHYDMEYGDTGDVCVTIEGCEVRNGMVNYTLTVLLDYISLYPTYIDKVDYVIFPTRWFVEMVRETLSKPADTWNAGAQKCLDVNIENNPKNLYLGSPKYDIEFDRGKICQKYGLNPDFKYTLVMYPRPEHRSGFDLDGICSDLLAAGKIPILKSRKKHQFWQQDLKNYPCFYDDTWFPPTALELMSVSEDIIGTDSTGVKEAVMMNRKMTNIPNKSYRILDELYEENAKEKFLYTENSSDRILNHMEENV